MEKQQYACFETTSKEMRNLIDTIPWWGCHRHQGAGQLKYQKFSVFWCTDFYSITSGMVFYKQHCVQKIKYCSISNKMTNFSENDWVLYIYHNSIKALQKWYFVLIVVFSWELSLISFSSILSLDILYMRLLFRTSWCCDILIKNKNSDSFSNSFSAFPTSTASSCQKQPSS